MPMKQNPGLKELALLHRALSSVARLRILRMLVQRPMCVNAITVRLGISQPAVSQHLRILSDSGLICGQRNGVKVHYCLSESGVGMVRDMLMELPYCEADDGS